MIWYLTRHYLRGRSGFLSLNAHLSFWGVFIGTALLVNVLAVFSGFQFTLMKSIESFDAHLKLELDKNFARVPITDWNAWTQKIREEVRIPMTSVEGGIEGPGLFRRGQQIDHVFVRGQQVTTGTDGLYRLPGHFPPIMERATSVPWKGDIAFIGKEMAALYGLKPGDTLELIVPRGQFSLKVGIEPSLRTFRVAALFKTGNYNYDSKVIVIPLQSAQSLYSIGNAVQSINIRIPDLNKLRESRFELSRTWYSAIRSIEDEHKTFFAALKLEKTIMVIIMALFIVLAMSLLIIATLNVVRSRRRDIGILKAMGYRDHQIAAGFALGSAIMGTAGSILGILTGSLMALNLNGFLDFLERTINTIGMKFFSGAENPWFNVEIIPTGIYYFEKLPVHIDVPFLSVAGVICILLSFSFAWLPARLAARENPLDIIRGADQ